MPLLSIIMATKDENSLHLQKCVNSILSQTFQDYDYYVIIDTKNDKNIQYLTSISNNNKNIKLLFNTGKPGVSSSRNFCILISKSKYIGIVDSDDFYHDHKIEKQVNYLEKNEDISVIGTNIFLVDDDNNIIGERLYPKTDRIIRKQFLYKMPIANTSI